MALAKVDVTTSPIVTKEYKIQNLPTLKFFRNGYVSDYDGGLSKEDVISFMQRKSEPLSVAYYSTQELKDHLTKDSSVIVGYFEDTESEEYDQWESVLSTMENIQAVHITSEDIADDMSVEIPSIYFYNGIENPHQFSGSIKDLKAWISLNTLPTTPLYILNNISISGEIFYPFTLIDLCTIILQYVFLPVYLQYNLDITVLQEKCTSSSSSLMYSTIYTT